MILNLTAVANTQDRFLLLFCCSLVVLSKCKMLVRKILIPLVSKGKAGRSETTLFCIQGILTQEAGRAGERGCCLHLSNICSSDNSYGLEALECCSRPERTSWLLLMGCTAGNRWEGWSNLASAVMMERRPAPPPF